MDKESISNFAPIFPSAARQVCRQPFTAHRQAKRHQHQTEPGHARKSGHRSQVVKRQPGGIPFWFHGHELAHFGWLVLIDKSCPDIALINDRRDDR
jgi:hypothetical protein